LGCRDGGGGVQAALADRAVFQSLKAKSAGEDLHRDFRQCPEDASLGGVDCHVVDQVPAVEGNVWLVAFQSGGAAAAAVVRLPRFVGVDRSSLSSPGVARSAARATGDGLAVVGQQSTSQGTELGRNDDFGSCNLDSIHQGYRFSRGQPASSEDRRG